MNEFVFLSWLSRNTWKINFDFKFQVLPDHQDRKIHSFVRFLREVSARQFCFEFYWPLENLNFTIIQYQMKILDLGIGNQSSFHDDRIPFFSVWLSEQKFKKDKNIFFFKTNPIRLFFQHSYGFIQCCDRQARLFFHFSQFDGNIEHLKIGKHS